MGFRPRPRVQVRERRHRWTVCDLEVEAFACERKRCGELRGSCDSLASATLLGLGFYPRAGYIGPIRGDSVQSMTGYGRGEASNSQVTVVVELKSVNNRFRDIQLRCPKEYMALEPRVNTMLKEPFQRGRIDAHIRRSCTGASKVVVADAKLAMEYMKVINDAAEEMVGFVVRDIPFTFILSQPGVLNVQEAQVDVMSEQEIVETALQSAIADLAEMRSKEGAPLTSRGTDAMMIVGLVSEAQDSINERLEAKLQGRLERLSASV